MAGQQAEKMQIVVDCQLLQTSDRQRGMGFYLKSLLAAIAEKNAQNKADVSWVFLINSSLPKLSDEDQRLLRDLDGQELSGQLLSQADCELFDQAAANNRHTVDALLEPILADKSHDKTIFFIPAMFSREIYPVFPTHGTANLMLFHDLIPFLYHGQYFHDHEGLPLKDYAQRFREVYRTNMFVTNSQTTADDLTVYFGVDPSRITPIFGAAADRQHVAPERPTFAKELKSGFVLMPSGDDFRKNNALAVQAFAALESTTKLVITSKFSEGAKRSLRDLCPNVIFSGSVSDGEFIWLLDSAKAVFFPTLYEGLGMPALEAVERGAKVVCSNIPVFTEISSDVFYCFEPTSVTSMTEALREVLNATEADSGWGEKRACYPKVLREFSWRKTAQLFLGAAGSCSPSPERKRLAVFCPSPSSYSSVGKYAFEVHAELSQLFDIDYYAEVGQTSFKPTRPNILEHAANYYAASSFDLSRVKQYDYVLYHIGNSEFHVDTILNSLRLSAGAIVHDTRLNGIFDYMQNRGFIPAERRELEALLDRMFNCRYSSCLASIATNQKTIFFHSQYAGNAIAEIAKDKQPKRHRVAHPIGVPSIELRRADNTTVSFAGIISEDKGIRLVAEVGALSGVQVRVFGFGVLGDSPLLQGLGDNVKITHDLSDKEFQDEVRTSDILVNYRPNYHGETSRSTLEAMRYGTVVIVKDVGWYGELPDNVVVKVDNETEALEAVRRLVEDGDMRRSIAAAARKFLSEEYSYKRYAELIKDGLKG